MPTGLPAHSYSSGELLSHPASWYPCVSSCTDPYPSTYRHAQADSYPGTYRHARADSYPGTHCHAQADTHASTHCHADAGTYTYSQTAQTNAYANPYSHTYANAYTYTYAGTHADSGARISLASARSRRQVQSRPDGCHG